MAGFRHRSPGRRCGGRAARTLAASIAACAAVLLPITAKTASPPGPAGTPGVAEVLPVPAGGASPTASSDTLNVAEALSIAARANPRILASREAETAAGKRTEAAGALPWPALRWTRFVEPVETRLGPQRDILALSQRLPFPGKLGLDRDASAAGALIEAERRREAELDVARRVKEACHALASADRLIAILEEQAALLDRMVAAARTRLETGRSGQHDVLGLEVERLRIDETILSRREERLVRRAELNALLGREDRPLVVVTPDRPRAIRAEAHETAVAGAPAVIAGAHEVTRRRAMRARRGKAYLPDFTLGVGWIRIDDEAASPEAGRDAWNVTLGATIPFPRRSTSSAVAEADGMLRAAEHTLAGEELRARAELRGLLSRYRTGIQRLRLYDDEMLPRARQALASAETGFATGEIDYLRLLDAERRLYDLMTAREAKRLAVEIAIAGIEAVSGLGPAEWREGE